MSLHVVAGAVATKTQAGAPPYATDHWIISRRHLRGVDGGGNLVPGTSYKALAIGGAAFK